MTLEGAVEYVIVCEGESGQRWATAKRYSQLRVLHTFAAAESSGDKLSFPRKTVGRISAKKLQRREKDLDGWLGALLGHCALRDAQSSRRLMLPASLIHLAAAAQRDCAVLSALVQRKRPPELPEAPQTSRPPQAPLPPCCSFPGP